MKVKLVRFESNTKLGIIFLYILIDVIFVNKSILNCEKLNINNIINIASASKIFIIIRPYSEISISHMHIYLLNCSFPLHRVKSINFTLKLYLCKIIYNVIKFKNISMKINLH